jgi:hypothetical protein
MARLLLIAKGELSLECLKTVALGHRRCRQLPDVNAAKSTSPMTHIYISYNRFFQSRQFSCLLIFVELKTVN